MIKEILAHAWFALCAVASIFSACICFEATNAHQYHVALPWGIAATLWACNVWQGRNR